MPDLGSLVLLAFLPFATGDKCTNQGGRCDQICSNDTVAASVNDCPGSQYCCVKKGPARPKAAAPPAGGKAPSGGGTTAPAEGTAPKEHFDDNILVCSPLTHTYVSSNREPLTCNDDHTSLHLLYKDGFRLIQIVDDGKKTIYYLERK